MNSEHSPEPWLAYFSTVEGIWTIQHAGGWIARMLDTTRRPSESNARRIVACVNACAGIETDILERMTEAKDLLKQLLITDSQFGLLRSSED